MDATDDGDILFSASEMGAIAHLYRGEIYRSTIWRTRLDTTTNWSVVSLSVALSISFANTGASPLPLIFVGLLVSFFLVIEARRYRFFNVWRARARWMEKYIYAPMLTDGSAPPVKEWATVLANDYKNPKYHISYLRAVGRRLRRNYIWLFLIQAAAYFGKIIVHPFQAPDLETIVARAALGPIPGWAVILAGLAFNAFWIGLALATHYLDAIKHKGEGTTVNM